MAIEKKINELLEKAATPRKRTTRKKTVTKKVIKSNTSDIKKYQKEGERLAKRAAGSIKTYIRSVMQEASTEVEDYIQSMGLPDTAAKAMIKAFDAYMKVNGIPAKLP